MNKRLSTILLCALITTPTMANDYWNEPNTPSRDNYVGFRLHKNENIVFQYDLDGAGKDTVRRDNFGFGAVVGNRLSDNIKIEFETLYTGAKHNTSDKKLDYDIWSNMFNVYLFQEFSGAIAPYVGIGIGFSGIWGDINATTYHISDSTIDLSYQAMIGVNFALNSRIDLNLGFKYQYYGEIEHKLHGTEFAKSTADATEFYIGAAYKFGIK